MSAPTFCIHCGEPTGYHALTDDWFCWPPCAHYVAVLRAALADPETAEGASALLDMAGVKVGEA